MHVVDSAQNPFVDVKITEDDVDEGTAFYKEVGNIRGPVTIPPGAECPSERARTRRTYLKQTDNPEDVALSELLLAAETFSDIQNAKKYIIDNGFSPRKKLEFGEKTLVFHHHVGHHIFKDDYHSFEITDEDAIAASNLSNDDIY